MCLGPMKSRPGYRRSGSAFQLRMLLIASAMIIAAWACAFPEQTSRDERVETAVAATFTALATDISPNGATSSAVANPTSRFTPTPSNTPPPEGISLNCDGTYQRVNLMDGGAEGNTIIVENWNGSEWVEAWSQAGGDPMLQQIEADAGPYLFGDCEYMVVVPLRYSGSGAVLELSIYRWTGDDMEQVYSHDGVHGEWSKLADTITFHESIYLYNEANCCPCNTQYLEHTWNGDEFEQTGSLIAPTYQGTPPAYCQG